MNRQLPIRLPMVFAACCLMAAGRPVSGEGGVYGELSVTYDAAETAGWSKVVIDGKPARLSPALKVPSDCEINHHRARVRYSGEGSVEVSVGYHPADDGAGAFDSPARHSRWQTVRSGQEIKAVASRGGDRFAWVALRTTGDVRIAEVKHACWRGRGTVYGHVGATYAFAGGKLPYRLMYPRNFDPKKRYPLVLSVHGSGGVGTDNVRSMELVILARHLFTDYYFDEEFECFSLVAQIPSGTAIPEPYWPKGDKGGPERPYHPDFPAVNENGWYAQATLSLIRTLLADKNFNIDPDRVYYTGFSYGGKACWEFLKAGREVFAAGISAAGWPIGSAFSNPEGKLAERLKLEVRRHKHIPVRIFAGEKDPMRLGSAAVHKEILAQGGESEYEEFPGVDHVHSAKRTWGNRKNIEWLFKQNRRDNPEPGADPFPGGDYPEP